MSGVLCYCRAGFEADLAAELEQQAAALGIFGYAKLQPNSGFVQFCCYQAEDGARLGQALRFEQLVFARQLWVQIAEFNALDSQDRVSTILTACNDYPHLPPLGDVLVEYPDTTQGREMSKFCRKFAVPLRQALRKQGRLTNKPDTRKAALHLLFLSGQQVFIGYSLPGNRSPHELGILRLKFPSNAPSRSTLKLDEAIQVFVSKHDQQEWLREGITAVDLGACPGGWTYQLVRRGVQVQAIDNGAMQDELMATGLVDYYPADGFKFKPAKPVHWLVCDMIEQPQRVAALMCDWLIEGHCQRAIFNLKLPMKKRQQSVQQAIQLIALRLTEAGFAYQLNASHLYHNREEVTVYLRPLAAI